jgi:hypothetical protein
VESIKNAARATLDFASMLERLLSHNQLNAAQQDRITGFWALRTRLMMREI